MVLFSSDISGKSYLFGYTFCSSINDMIFSTSGVSTNAHCNLVSSFPWVNNISPLPINWSAPPLSRIVLESAHILPEYKGEESSKLDIDIDDRDALFNEAAEIIVTAQQGSASLLQRKLKLGYNRAGRLIDQMESAGIVGPFEGSKPRQVLVTDLTSLNKILNND